MSVRYVRRAKISENDARERREQENREEWRKERHVRVVVCRCDRDTLPPGKRNERNRVREGRREWREGERRGER